MSSDTDTIKIVRGDSSAVIHLFGATVISWKVDDTEILFVSHWSPRRSFEGQYKQNKTIHKNAVFDNKKAIRGGIPFVFPQFGPWDLGPQHGFARITRWTVAREPIEVENGDVQVILKLTDNEYTRTFWDHSFTIMYAITLRSTGLTMGVSVCNAGSKNFTFTCLLHTYLSVPDVTKCLITGLNGCIYQDKTKRGESFTESRFNVLVSEATDRVYQNTADENLVTNCVGGNSIAIVKEGFPDTVVWNPWEENAKKMSDFGDYEYKEMICVEAGCVTEPITLAPQEIFHACQTLNLAEGLL